MVIDEVDRTHLVKHWPCLKDENSQIRQHLFDVGIKKQSVDVLYLSA